MQTQTLQRIAEQRRKLAEVVEEIETMDLEQLHSLWKKVYGHRSFTRSKVYLRRMLVHNFEEVRKNGSAVQVRGAIHSLTLRAANAARREHHRAQDLRDGAPWRDPRLPSPGTVLRRRHGGADHDVVVLESGCLYEGEHYRSLSAVAVKISGGPVNGYAFFARALRDAEQPSRCRGEVRGE